jgi:hypothetical protein
MWLWFSRNGAAPDEEDRCWQAFLRRFDLEHFPHELTAALGRLLMRCAAWAAWARCGGPGPGAGAWALGAEWVGDRRERGIALGGVAGVVEGVHDAAWGDFQRADRAV